VRILVCSDLYPPASLGGYEVAAREVTDALRDRGHEVGVLTSDHRADAVATVHEPGVARALHSRLDARWTWRSLPRAGAWEREDMRAASTALADLGPDVILLWNVGSLAHDVLALLMNGAVPAVVYVFGDWPLRKHRSPADLDYWASSFAPRAEASWRRTARSLYAWLARGFGVGTRAAPLAFEHFEFGSRFMMDLFHRGGLAATRSERLIYYGVFGEFARAASQPVQKRPRADRMRLLFVGRLWEAKGAHTVVEALTVLGRQHRVDATLTIAGPAEHTDYVASLRRRAEELGVASAVQWAGPVPRDRLPDLYAAHDALVFPSVYEEPFGIVQLEAMATGCAVVGTGTGGSAEILEAGENALIFGAGDPSGLAAQLARLRGDGVLARRLREGGKQTVRSRFMGARMVEEIEAHLEEVAARRHR
jgi:glycosyltransferase involved in cell wall biosynthesis